MSRNIRQKHPITPVKASKRRGSDSSSSLGDLSDSDGYSAVGDISDSDEDDEDVIAAEEEHILEYGGRESTQSSPRPVFEQDEEGDDEAADDDDEDEEDDDDDDEDTASNDNASWEGIMSGNEADVTAPQGVVERRVRFDVPESDGDTTETDEEINAEINHIFPDIFVAQSSLDPSFRREIEHDDDHSSDSGSFWDLHSHDNESQPFYQFAQDGATFTDNDVFAALLDSDSTPVATPMTGHDFSTAMSTPVGSPEKELDQLSMDGYSSDEEDGGDTTDEDEEPAKQPIRRKPRKELSAQSSDSDNVILSKPRPGKPRIGKFNLDSDGKKPVAVVNPRTGKLMIFTPQKLSRLDLSPEAFNFSLFQPLAQTSPILSSSGNLMMGAMMSSSTFGDYFNSTQPVGPVEAFFSTMSPTSNLEDVFEDDEDDDDDAADDEDEQRLAINDFLVFDGTDDEGLGDVDLNDDYLTTLSRPGSAGGDPNCLLSHFEHNSDIVGAFRRDQANSQLLRSGKATKESLAFSGPLFQGTLRGIKDGHISATNTPISPLRKQKKKRVPNPTSSPLSSVSQKRKSSSELHLGHKRRRSSIDINPLSISG